VASARPGPAPRSLHHVGCWADDLAEAQSRGRAELGVGPFLVIEHVPFESFAVTDGDRVRRDDGEHVLLGGG
jgi:hypothetical protein